jgi:hypothetical protein
METNIKSGWVYGPSHGFNFFMLKVEYIFKGKNYWTWLS